MLLFILAERKGQYMQVDSNTSHVTLYLTVRIPLTAITEIQIHLMLLFITDQVIPIWKEIRIQIHLMLLFIFFFSITPSVITVIQIHLMLLFIGKMALNLAETTIFKYISCYSLSSALHRISFVRNIQIHLMLLFIRLA